MNRARAFLKLLSALPSGAVRFTDHFRIRKEARGVSEAVIEDLLFNRKQDLIHVEQKTSSRGLRRFKAYYSISKKKALLVVLDLETNNSLSVVTSMLMDKKAQLAAMRNARRYEKLANRLR